MKYNPIEDRFVNFEAVETPKVEINLPLFDTSLNISEWATSKTNNETPIVRNNLRNPLINNNQKYDSIVEPSPYYHTSSTTDLSFEELIKQENLPIRITSGFRGESDFRGGKTKQGKRSNHNKRDEQGNPMAYDIVPTDGNFEGLLNKMYSNPRVVEWFKSKGYGILEETNPEVMRRTGATGKHLHIGPDSWARQMFEKRLLKGQEGLKFPFMTFEAVEVETPEITLPLIDSPIDVSNWSSRVAENGTPIVQNNLRNPMINNNRNNQEIIEPEQEEVQEEKTTAKSSYKPVSPSTPGYSTLSRIIDEVSQEPGYEGLKNKDIKDLLMFQAKRESGFNHKAKSSSSTASGYFQFIDSTRKKFSTLDRKQFLNDPKEQVRAAYKLLKNIHESPNAQKLLSKGYNMAQVTALGWWYPDSMRMVLNGQRNFSKGGYSIQKALSDYQV